MRWSSSEEKYNIIGKEIKIIYVIYFFNYLLFSDRKDSDIFIKYFYSPFIFKDC